MRDLALFSLVLRRLFFKRHVSPLQPGFRRIFWMSFIRDLLRRFSEPTGLLGLRVTLAAAQTQCKK